MNQALPLKTLFAATAAFVLFFLAAPRHSWAQG